jgi:hypothetical protein
MGRKNGEGAARRPLLQPEKLTQPVHDMLSAKD